MTIFGLILDLVMIGLLGTMIFFAVRLHRRLEVLRTGKQDLEILLRDLVTNTATAERNLRDLQVVAEELAPSLQKQVAGARAAREELEFLLGSADAAADKLLAQIGAAKGEIRSEHKISTSSTPVSLPSTAAEPAPTLRAMPPISSTIKETQADDSRRTAEADLLRAIEKLR